MLVICPFYLDWNWLAKTGALIWKETSGSLTPLRFFFYFRNLKLAKVYFNFYYILKKCEEKNLKLV